MNLDDVTIIVDEALWLVIKTSTPVLMVSLVVGLIISVFQTATSIQEQTLTFVPKVICVFGSIILLGSWMGTELTDYMVSLWNNFSVYIR